MNMKCTACGIHIDQPGNVASVLFLRNILNGWNIQNMWNTPQLLNCFSETVVLVFSQQGKNLMFRRSNHFNPERIVHQTLTKLRVNDTKNNRHHHHHHQISLQITACEFSKFSPSHQRLSDRFRGALVRSDLKIKYLLLGPWLQLFPRCRPSRH